MEKDTPLSRRSILAAVCATGGISSVASAQERDPTQFDRPRTVTENGVEITMWDCSRVIVDSQSNQIDHIEVHVMYPRYGDESRTYLTVLDNRITVLDFELPVDINVNAHIDDFDPPAGSVIINFVRVVSTNGDTLINPNWPINEWECYEIMNGDLDPEAAQEFKEIDYTYDVYLDFE